MSQNLEALAHGNEIRLARAKVRHWIGDCKDKAESRKRLATVLRHPPDEIFSMQVGELLMCAHRTGRLAMLRWLRFACVSEDRQIGALTERQRVRLCAFVLASIGGRVSEQDRSGNDAQSAPLHGHEGKSRFPA